jgi:hypothetical protein
MKKIKVRGLSHDNKKKFVELWLQKNGVTKEFMEKQAGRELKFKEMYLMAIACERKGVSIFDYKEGVND